MDRSPVPGAESVPLCNCASNDSAPPTLAGRRLDLVLVLALWLLHSVGHLWWIAVDTRPPFSDAARHAIRTIHISTFPWRQILIEGRILDVLPEFGQYPPLLYLTAMSLVKLFGPTVDALLIVNIFYFGLLIFSTYGIGRLAVGSKVGLLAAFLVSMYPILYGLSRHYMIELALVAMTAFAIFCLYWSEAFRWRVPSLVVGIAFGMGMLAKWTFAVFVLGPLLFALYLVQRHGTRGRWINVLLAGVVGLTVALPYYLVNLEPLREYLQLNRAVAGPVENDPAVWTMASWVFYLVELVNQQLLLPFVLLFVLGTILTLRHCKPNAYLWMLLSWVVVGYVVSALFINKDTRYTMPYLPAMALLSAIGFVQIRWTVARRVGLVLIISYALVQYAGLTVGLSDKISALPAQISGSLGEHMPFTIYAESIHMASPARAENWQVDAIIDTILADVDARSASGQFTAPSIKSPLQLLVLPTANYFDAQAFTYVQWRDRLPLEVSIVTGIVKVDSERAMQRSDYVVTKSGDLGWAFALQDAGTLTAQLFDPSSALRADFELMAEFPLPDGSTAQLFRHLRESSE